MSAKNYLDTEVWVSRYIKHFLNCKDKAELTEEIDAAYARANSIEKNRNMTNPNWLTKKKSWIKIAKGLQEIRKNL